jgi:hypothetical protein
MPNLWPWLVIAGVGALHGLSPVTGWMFAAASGLRAHDQGQALRALAPIAIGHACSVAVVAWAVVHGRSMHSELVRDWAGVVLLAITLYRVARGDRQSTPMCAHAQRAGVALWSFLMATAHGTGSMLVPGLVPLCLGASAAGGVAASGALAMGVAAVCVHLAAMLVTTGVIACGVCRCVLEKFRWLNDPLARQIWTAALGVTGALLLVLR